MLLIKELLLATLYHTGEGGKQPHGGTRDDA